MTSREPVFQAVILNRYNVTYFVCNACGLLQTEPPYWLDEAYTEAIAICDTGLVSRNVSMSRKLAPLLYFLMDKKGRYLDVAGGYGVLTRLMRDIGFDFYWSDPYCTNILAKGFEHNPGDSFSAITAFEVLEHVQEPVSFIADNLKMANASTIIFSTELYEGNPPGPEDWWYYALPSGQHVSFYKRSTLEAIARKLSLNLYSTGNFHMLTSKTINALMFRLMVSRISGVFYAYVARAMDSKTLLDHQKLQGYKKS